MRRQHLAIPALIAGLSVMAGCTAGFLGGAGPALRPTNVELHILSQSCFQGEIEPCG
jgi:hypothetical protein